MHHRHKPETRFVDIAGKKTQWTVAGQGSPLVYLHSAGGETDWMPFHDGLADSFQVHLPAHPGFALSGGLDEIRDMQDMVWHYADLFESLGLHNVPVVGFSLGAWLAIELEILRPGTISKLVLVAAAGLHVPGSPMAELFIEDLGKLRQLLFYNPEDPCVDLAMPRSLQDDRILMWLRAREATARVGWNPYLHNPKLPRHLHRVKCPTLLIWGDTDRLIPPAHGEFYAKHLPNARLEILPQCGHMLPFEKTTEFVEKTTQWFQQ